MCCLLAGAVVFSRDSTSVTESINVLGAESDGSVVTLGLSSYQGSVLSIADRSKQHLQTDGSTLILKALEAKSFGYGTRLQYTLYGADRLAGTFKITAHTDAAGDSKVLIGIYSISEPPQEGKRRSGSLGTINTEGATYTRNDEGLIEHYAQLFPDGDIPAMFLLTEDDPVDIVVDIEASDTWTGYETNQGAWLFYELLEFVDVEVYFTMVPQ